MKNYYYNRFNDVLEVCEAGDVPAAVLRADGSGEQSDDWSGPYPLPTLAQAEADYNAETRGGATESRAVVRYLREMAPDTEVAEAMSHAVELASEDVAAVHLASDAVFDRYDEDENRRMRAEYVEFLQLLGLGVSARAYAHLLDEDARHDAVERDSTLYSEWHSDASDGMDPATAAAAYREDEDIADGELPVGYCEQSDARRELRRFCERKNLRGYLVVRGANDAHESAIIGAGWTAADAERDADETREGWRTEVGMPFETKRVPADLMLAVERDGSTTELASAAVRS